MNEQALDIEQIYKDSLEMGFVADSYCKSRGINNMGFGYCKFLKYNNRLLCEVIVIPVRDATGKLVMLEVRSTKFKEHYKLVKDPSYHIYNIENAINNLNYVIVTEGVFDAETLIQRGYNAVATLTASIPTATKHILTAFDNVIFAYDNDSAGVKAMKELVSFYNDNYPDTNIDIAEYEGKDLNDAVHKGLIDEATKELDSILNMTGLTK